jgi:hypothetical protein
MTNSKSPTDKKDSFNWREIFLRAVIPGILLAIAGFISEWVITSSSSKAENARLVTDLQIQREQAESDLRKDIFSKAVEALIGDTDQQNKIADHSKRILKLELLALNFGDSIFLSPLFNELEKDLRQHMKAEPIDSLAALELIGRLRSLAKRVSREQLSFLSQRGTSVQIRVPLSADGKRLCDNKIEFKWPIDMYPGIQLCLSNEDETWINDNGESAPFCKDTKEGQYVTSDEFKGWLMKDASVSLNNLDAEKRHIIAVFSEPEPEQASISVNLSICNDFKDISGCDPDDANTVQRTFTLDYFNFPTIDNTRLPNNDRFAVVLADYPEKHSGNCNSLEIYVALFPYEYASLRDRPTMRESLEMLQRAQQD